jgi:hypothetical protein
MQCAYPAGLEGLLGSGTLSLLLESAGEETTYE